MSGTPSAGIIVGAPQTQSGMMQVVPGPVQMPQPRLQQVSFFPQSLGPQRMRLKHPEPPRLTAHARRRHSSLFEPEVVMRGITHGASCRILMASSWMAHEG
ncbi:hypothetical protein A176_007304 [Myxococcus hansupus]|uniref:Uncharacterized protein n=1 Tax=Pseudomyxococcus hansupus TaxID=1297742 RepID=A0A0H4XPU0_9BACT|nr:hypothetical protein A176_007304 [Myxococcus hansupus]